MANDGLDFTRTDLVGAIESQRDYFGITLSHKEVFPYVQGEAVRIQPLGGDTIEVDFKQYGLLEVPVVDDANSAHLGNSASVSLSVINTKVYAPTQTDIDNAADVGNNASVLLTVKNTKVYAPDQAEEDNAADVGNTATVQLSVLPKLVHSPEQNDTQNAAHVSAVNPNTTVSLTVGVP